MTPCCCFSNLLELQFLLFQIIKYGLHPLLFKYGHDFYGKILK